MGIDVTSGRGVASAGGNTALVPGSWYPADASAVTGLLLVQGSVYATPVSFNPGHTFTAIGTLVNAAATAGGVARFGLYADTGAGAPGALITDFGTVATTAVTAITIAASIPLQAGQLVWAVIAAQGAPATQVTIWSNNGRTSGLLGQTGPLGAPQSWVGTGVAGALPGTFPGGATLATPVPVVQLLA